MSTDERAPERRGLKVAGTIISGLGISASLSYGSQDFEDFGLISILRAFLSP